MWTSSRACWQSFVDWLSSGVSGIRPDELRLTLGPVYALLPLARQAAEALGPWLLSLLAECQRAGRVSIPLEDEWQAAKLLAEDAGTRLLSQREARRPASWLIWLLEAELARLVEAPTRLLYRPDWLASEVRYWALVVSLARLGQLYALLERRQGHEAAGQIWAGAAERVWQQATGAAQTVA